MRRAGAALLLVLTAGCTAAGAGGTGSPDRTDATPAVSAAPTTPTPTPMPTPTPTSPPPAAARRTTTPLVLAVHPARTGLTLTVAQARRVVARQVGGWADLGRAARPLRLVDGVTARRTASPAAALRAVGRDPDALALVPGTAMHSGVVAVPVGGVDPLRTPARYRLRTAGPPPPRPATLTVVGDLMLGRRVGADGAPGEELRYLQDRLKGSDLTVGNLESTLSRAGAPRQGPDSFAADPRVLPRLRAAGFDVLSLANNHSGDFGPRALVQTVQRIRAAGMAPLGAGADATAARRPVIVERAGVRFGLLAFNAIGETPSASADRPGAVSLRMPPRTGPLNRGDLSRMQRAIAALRPRVDVVVVLPHWGRQYTHTPVAAQRTVALALVRAGADLVVGGHPHWVQGLELADDRLVLHSLGNAVFDMDFMTQTQQGVLLEAVVWTDRVVAARLVPYRIGADFAPRLATGSERAEILDDVRTTSRPPFSLDPRR